MFQTTERSVVEEKCAREGFTAEWGDDNSLKLYNTQPAAQKHPETGESVWFNHAAVTHRSIGDGELSRVFKYRPSLRSFAAAPRRQGVHQASTPARPGFASHELQLRRRNPDPDSDMEAVREAIWKNQVINPWKKGDVIAIDNDSIAHGRMPFYGPRMIAVAWA